MIRCVLLGKRLGCSDDEDTATARVSSSSSPPSAPAVIINNSNLVDVPFRLHSSVPAVSPTDNMLCTLAKLKSSRVLVITTSISFLKPALLSRLSSSQQQELDKWTLMRSLDGEAWLAKGLRNILEYQFFCLQCQICFSLEPLML